MYPNPERCEYCGPGIHTGLPNGACENCMNTGYKYPERAEEYDELYRSYLAHKKRIKVKSR